MDDSVPATMLGFDDTDSPDGMCTTYLAILMLGALKDYDLLGPPRLVRLNPNVPWKTRGNAAICLPLGVGHGRQHVCGEQDGREIVWYESGEAVEPGDVLEIAAEVLKGFAHFDCHSTNPGLVVTRDRPSSSLYWRAVRGVVTLRSVESELARAGAKWVKYKNGRGVIGAAAAVSWRPRDRTWEVITYRAKERIGRVREVDPSSVIDMDKNTRWTFNNYDFENDHVAICPGSACPVLFGIRGDSSEELLEARLMIRGEAPDRWLLFMTNQGTDDHISKKRISALNPGDSVQVTARVVGLPENIPGGHVVVRLSDGSEIDAAFYEPSRGLRSAARALIPGDEVTVHGSVRTAPRSLNVEKMRIVRLVEQKTKTGNPICASCGKRMGSLGHGKGYRCKRCGSKALPEAAEQMLVPRSVATGWYEPPVSSRRHLHKPLRRMSRGNINKI